MRVFHEPYQKWYRLQSWRKRGPVFIQFDKTLVIGPIWITWDGK